MRHQLSGLTVALLLVMAAAANLQSVIDDVECASSRPAAR